MYFCRHHSTRGSPVCSYNCLYWHPNTAGSTDTWRKMKNRGINHQHRIVVKTEAEIGQIYFGVMQPRHIASVKRLFGKSGLWLSNESKLYFKLCYSYSYLGSSVQFAGHWPAEEQLDGPEGFRLTDMPHRSYSVGWSFCSARSATELTCQPPSLCYLSSYVFCLNIWCT